MGLKNVLVQGSELYFLFSFLKRLVTKFEKTDAYKLGIIDKNGKVLIKKRDFTTIEQRNAFTMMDTLIFNLKKLLGKIPFGKTTIATYAAALLLLREEKNLKILADEKILEEKFSNLYEDVLHEWNEDDFLTEGDMEADREAGIKWVDNPDWKKLHDMDLQMVKDFLKHKEVKEDAPTMSMAAGGIAGSAEAGDDPPVRKKKKKGEVLKRLEPMGIGEQIRIFPSHPNHNI
tara:strand:+ start:1435 stop:2127 length:693 start_codon:yes stop_codon:yes gene_type:complete